MKNEISINLAWYDSFKPFSSRNTSPKQNWVEADASGYFYYHLDKLLKGGALECFDPLKAVHFAQTIPEVFIPIDAIADRVQAVDYVIFNKNTDEPLENVPARLQELMQRPNPFHSGKELIYQIIFSELASGGSYTLTKMPSVFKTKNYEKISNIWCLNPDHTITKIKKTIPDPFLVTDKKELIEEYVTHWLCDVKLMPDEVYFNTITKVGNDLRAKSPLDAVAKNINNLIAVYSARYNVYAKNGKSGIVFKDEKGTTGISQQVNPVTRQQVLDDIQNRDGITGDKNFTGISSFPLGFIETLGKIRDLEPFKETEADAITIGGNFNVDKELLPREKSTTFTNQRDVEKHLWQNTIQPYSEEVAKTLTQVYYLPSEWEFRPVSDNIDILQADRKTTLEADKLEIENLKTVQELGGKVEKQLEKWNDQ